VEQIEDGVAADAIQPILQSGEGTAAERETADKSKSEVNWPQEMKFIWSKRTTPLPILVLTFAIVWGVYYFLMALMYSTVVFYFLSRTYLVVECFLQLPYLPEGAFLVPSFSQYWSHF
jgi:hypothetical protein